MKRSEEALVLFSQPASGQCVDAAAFVCCLCEPARGRAGAAP